LRASQTGGAAFMREGPNLLKLARKEQCMALLTQLRTGFKLDGRIYRVYPSGEVQYLHPKDGVYPEKLNKGRVGVNNNMRSIGKNVNPAQARARRGPAGAPETLIWRCHSRRFAAACFPRRRLSSAASWGPSRCRARAELCRRGTGPCNSVAYVHDARVSHAAAQARLCTRLARFAAARTRAGPACLACCRAQAALASRCERRFARCALAALDGQTELRCAHATLATRSRQHPSSFTIRLTAKPGAT
jgi:hypothetical protein